MDNDRQYTSSVNSLQDGFSASDSEVALVATEAEARELSREVKSINSLQIDIVGVFEKLECSEHSLQSAEDFLTEENPFYNHFNGSDKFNREVAVESPPENGDEWHRNQNDEYSNQLTFFDDLNNFAEFIGEENPDYLIFSEAHNYSNEIQYFLNDCAEENITVLPFAEFFRAVSKKEPIVNFSDHSFLYDFEFPKDTTTQKIWRRMVDVGISVSGIILLSPIWFLISIAIKLTSSGPVIFKQDRVGKNGEVFTLYKFRTMVENAEENDNPQWANEEDDRVTKFGRFLRLTRLDETLQFVNVLKNDMRLIGPRPERPEFVEKLRKKIPFYNYRHRVQPGVTGWAQIYYGYGACVEDAMIKLQYDLYGIKHRSIKLDLKILWETLWLVFGFKGR